MRRKWDVRGRDAFLLLHSARRRGIFYLFYNHYTIHQACICNYRGRLTPPGNRILEEEANKVLPGA